MARVYAVVAAAGQSTRMGGINKQLMELCGVPVIIRSLSALEQVSRVEGIVVAASPEILNGVKEAAAAWGLKKVEAVIPGGINRQQSVMFGLLAVPFDSPVVIVHDGARPLVTTREVEDLIESAGAFGAATLAVPVKDTVKEAGPDGFVASTPDRSRLWLTQTPQGFSRELLLNAHRRAESRGELFTDDASLVEASGHRVRIVAGSYSNIKITTPEDLVVAEAILNRRAP